MDIFEMPEKRRKEVLQKLKYFFKEDEQAVKMCIDLLFIGHLWDDLIDQDKPRSAAEINKAFTLALGEIGINPYYPGTYHLIRNSICQWEVANELAQGSADEKLISFLIRNALFEICSYLMFLTGGDDWVRQEGANFWRYFGKGMAAKYQEFLGEVTENA